MYDGNESDGANEAGTSALIGARLITEGPVDTVCRLLCRLAMIALIVVIDLEIVTRNVFGFSFYLSDEYGGYLLVALAFLSLPLCVTHNSLHRVTFFLEWLPATPRQILLLLFDVLALLFCLVILWELALLVQSSHMLQTNAPTLVLTPLWIPQLVMPIGMAATAVTLTRSILRRIATLLLSAPARQDE